VSKVAAHFVLHHQRGIIGKRFPGQRQTPGGRALAGASWCCHDHPLTPVLGQSAMDQNATPGLDIPGYGQRELHRLTGDIPVAIR